MPGLQLSFTKVVFPPSSFAAVHTYTAGSFFAVIALKTETTEHDVHLTGKAVFSQLETDFFSLEEKTLATIKEAINQSLNQLPEGIHASLSATYIKDSVAYVFVCGGGSILLKRADSVGSILNSTVEQGRTLLAASGKIQPEDLLFLQTTDFGRHISSITLQNLSDRLPNEIADTLTNRLQTVENSGAASIILKVEGILKDTQPASLVQKDYTPMPEPSIEQVAYPLVSDVREENNPLPLQTKRHISVPHISLKLPHLVPTGVFKKVHLRTKTKIGLVIVVLVIVLFAASILYTQKVAQAKHTDQVFNQYYDQAQQQYNSGNAINAVNSNATSSRVAYQKADSLLKTAQKELPSDSPQEKQVNDLLAQVDSKIQQTDNIQTVQVTSASASDSPLLALEQQQKAQYVSQDTSTLYYVTHAGIYKSSSSSPVIQNTTIWKNAGGFASYDDNLYVLDKQSSIIKFVGGSSGYGQGTYFAQDTTPNLSNAVSMAIDSSVYVLFADGTINKYTKGEPDTFTIQNLSKPFASPTRIFTTSDTTSVYVLDNGNGRIVQLGKDGTFEKQYVADQLAKATDIDVQETNKKIYFLTGSGIFSIDL